MQQQTINPQQTGTNWHASDVSFGGHDLFDIHEVLSGTIGAIEQYVMFQESIQDPELKNIATRQQQFLLDTYNILADCFHSGKNPSRPTSKYQMTQANDVQYGLKASQPKKPKLNANEINDECISGMMLGLMKANAGQWTMAATECTNPVVRRVLADCIPNVVEMAYEIFLYQNKHQYYQVPQLPQQDAQMMIQSYAPANNAMQGGTRLQ
ncbi:spore coat protein [Bacillaceae bacterium Marseille-Q3522]|nr:spore coat protein [Bacillaceae bacterium Marseille-Q3522]